MEYDFAKSKGIQLEKKIPEGTEVYGDPGMIFNIIKSVVNNGIEYTAHGGKIEIGMSESVREGYRTIYIKDNGMGMSQEKIDYIFRPESKLIDSTGSNNERGGGLGLVLTKEFIDKNGGEITVESTLDVGSEFRIALPEAPPEILEEEVKENSL